MRFAHLADCHLGAWREPRMRDLNHQAFQQAIERIILERAEFAIIAGDLFNNALPSLESLRHAVEMLRRLRDTGIPVYVVPGSHDCAPSGKSILDVLESAGLVRNVVRGDAADGKLRLLPTVDGKSGAKMFGLLGKRAGLEREYYDNLDRQSLEGEQGEKVFIFHGPIAELKSEAFAQMDAMPLSLLPRGFSYYAGGHVHTRVAKVIEPYGLLCYPGPTFPNSFSELEELRHGSFALVTDGKVEFVALEPRQCRSVALDCAGMQPADVIPALEKALAGVDIGGAVLTLRLQGTLSSGRVSDIPLQALAQSLEERGAYAVLRNTAGLGSPEFQHVRVEKGSAEEMESRMIGEHAGSWKSVDVETESERVRRLLDAFSTEKPEGQTAAQYEAAIQSLADLALGLGQSRNA